jgi:hypothetical protein
MFPTGGHHGCAADLLDTIYKEDNIGSFSFKDLLL